MIISTLEIALANIHRDVLVLMYTLEIVLANILRGVLVLLIKPTFGVHTSFFSGSHLSVSRTHRYALPRETTCACFHLQRKLGEELS